MNLTLVLCLMALSFSQLLANSGGVLGKTTLNSGGCGGSGCHGSSKNTATILSVLNTKPIKATPGQTITIEIQVEHPTAVAAGVNFAVRTTEDGITNVGTLVRDNGLQLANKQLTHTTPKTMSGGKAVFTFSWTAPTEAGTYYLQAIGNAVNRNSNADFGDSWNWMEPQAIVVEPVSGIDEERLYSQNVTISPLPASDIVTMKVNNTTSGEYVVNVTDITGTSVFSERINLSEHGTVFWNGMNSSGAQVPNGIYGITITGNEHRYSGSTIIQR